MRPHAAGGGQEAPDVAPADGAGDGPGDHRARGGTDRARGSDGLDGGHQRLLAHLVRGAGGGRAGGAAGELFAGQEPAGPPEDRQGRRPVDRAADRDGDAAVLVRAAAGDPGAAGLHPARLGPDRRPHPVLAAAGEAAGRRPLQADVRGVEAGRAPDRPRGHRGDDRRGTRPAAPRLPGPGEDAQREAPRAGRGAVRHAVRPAARVRRGVPAARHRPPGRRAQGPARAGHRAPGRDPRLLGRGLRRRYRAAGRAGR